MGEAMSNSTMSRSTPPARLWLIIKDLLKVSQQFVEVLFLRPIKDVAFQFQDYLAHLSSGVGYAGHWVIHPHSLEVNI